MSIENKEIAAIREDYAKGHLHESDVLADPMEQFKCWFQEALKASIIEPNAMCLSTVDSQGQPSSRIVLLKDIKPDGISFFTNYNSEKGQQIAANDQVSVLFFWPELQRQVRIQAHAQKLSAQESDEYFSLRPRASRIGAIASPQSSILSGREELEKRVEEVQAEFQQKEYIPRPEHWGGYFLKPHRLEFWQGGSSRLHDRIVYQKREDNWQIIRLAP